MTDIDTANKFLVGMSQERIVFLRPLPTNMTKQDALILAAYLVALADDDDSFPAILEAVQNT